MAGSWGATTVKETTTGIFKISKTFTADAADGTIPAWPITDDTEISDFHGLLTGVELEVGATAPNGLIVTLKTPDGQSLPGFPAAALSASGWIRGMDYPPLSIAGGLSGTFVQTAVATNSATGTIILYGIR